ncbi:MAG: hypothetical protein ABI083_13600 [Lapillicoccus sp.]
MTIPASTPSDISTASGSRVEGRPAFGTPELADAVAAAARSVPGVADLHTGAFGEVATYLPGRRVNGVRLRPDVTEVHLVLAWGSPLLQTADEVRSVVAALVPTPVDVTIEDVVEPLLAQPSPSGS